MSQIDILNKLNMIDPSDPNYVKTESKRSGLEIALEALKKSNPRSSVIPYLEKQLKKSTTQPIDEKVSESQNIDG